ncbi:MAG TPA: prepilin-type N-terminal cleavage/methylation domain-containing protein, partial [Armatimonadota bacterium]|nr:prepilin-type N-terminal cleavage/methylation domain-containing protein [Armatimonadota bacterium]
MGQVMWDSRTARVRGIRRRARRAGFTLLEALVALVLTGLLTAGVAMALRTGLDASERVRERSDAHAEARAAFEVLAADLGSAYLSGANTEETLFKAEPAAEVPAGDPFLSFTTLSYRRSHRAAGEGPAPRSDAVRVEYALQPSENEPGRGVLVRRERWLTETGAGVTEVVCEGVAGIRMRFSNGGEMQDGWSADAAENAPLSVTPD